MNRSEHLLTCLAEECCEVGQRASKAVRFGLVEVQKNQPLNNAERIVEELRDLFAVTTILIEEGIIPPFEFAWHPDVEAKRAKIERYMVIARETGALSETVAS